MTTHAPNPIDWLLLVLLALGLPLRAWLAMRRLRAASEDEAARLRPRLWLRAITTQWLLSAAVILQWLVTRRPLDSLSLSPALGWGAAGVLLGVAVMAVLFGAQRRGLASSPEVAARLSERLAPVKRLMPASRAEWPGFVALCLTAGVCEELLFRGFLLWLFAQFLPAWWQAALAQAALFGIAHAYQGARGVLQTFAVGVFLTGVMWISGAIWPAMLVHALLDLNSGDFAVRIAGLQRSREVRPA
ncbi:MAG: CPBP family intramembrane metalloprotease [Candidatus Eisenbacteria bacterium]|nr:CPBP family intramembrane metalloprotease [Candidatus Eisenbacteria bacterium]